MEAIPDWQRELESVPGIPVEYWSLPEDELKEKLKSVNECAGCDNS